LDRKLRGAVATWNQQQARGVILDHREGHGGTSQTANIVASAAVKPWVPLVGLFRGTVDDEGPVDATEGKALFDSMKGSAGLRAGSWKADTERPVALLLTWDVSASDFLPLMMKGAPSVRLFGPGPTMGAFGTFVQYSMWGAMRWSVGIEDSIDWKGMPLCGRGVEPDEVVLPKQSDLLQGKDTLHEAALRWIRREMQP
jgi:C-terminal processing protease CtpA/Prc